MVGIWSRNSPSRNFSQSCKVAESSWRLCPDYSGRVLFLKRVNKLYKIALLFFVLLFSSCSNFQEVTISKIENLKILKFSAQGIEVGLDIIIKNPNALGFSVYSSSFDVKLNDIFVGTANMKDKVKIAAHSEEIRTFIFESDLSSLNLMSLPAILSMMQEKKINVLVEGKLKVGNFFYKRNVPVNLKQTIPLSQ